MKLKKQEKISGFSLSDNSNEKKQELIRGHVKKNYWSANENTIDKTLTASFVFFYYYTTTTTDYCINRKSSLDNIKYYSPKAIKLTNLTVNYVHRDCMVVGFITTCAISEFEPCSWRGA